MMEHKKVHLTLCAWEADVDIGIADLVWETWKSGISVFESCENHTPRGWVWLQFSMAEEAARFLNIVAGKYEEADDSLYQRIARTRGCAAERLENDWRYDASAIDFGLFKGDDWDVCSAGAELWEDGPELCKDGPVEIGFRFNVRFPRQDIDLVTARLQDRNEKRKA